MKLPRTLRDAVLKQAGVHAAPAGAGDCWGVLAAVRAAGHPDPEQEWRFDDCRLWRFDFAWPGLKVAFERHGGTFVAAKCPNCGFPKSVFKSRHHDRKGLEDDLDKVTTAQILGWIVVQATPPMIRDGRAATLLLDALAARTGP